MPRQRTSRHPSTTLNGCYRRRLRSRRHYRSPEEQDECRNFTSYYLFQNKAAMNVTGGAAARAQLQRAVAHVWKNAVPSNEVSGHAH